MLRNRRTGKLPVFYGPSFSHMSRKTEDYLMFTQGLVRFRQELVDLKAYGTDNEDALRNALRITFANSVSLLCRLHKKENIEQSPALHFESSSSSSRLYLKKNNK